jgi:hypothetical protein
MLTYSKRIGYQGLIYQEAVNLVIRNQLLIRICFLGLMPYVPPKKKSFNILYDQAKYTGMLTKPSK